MSTENVVVVHEPQNVVVVLETVNDVEIGSPGPQGAQGPAGTNVLSGFYFTQDFTNSSNWIVNHNLNARPGVTVIIGGEEVDADVFHSSTNSLTVNFPGPETGTVVCS